MGVVFATSWSLLNMAQKQKTKKKGTETEAKPSCGLCHKLVIAEHGTKTKETKKQKETETEAKPSCGLCHKLVIAEHDTQKKRKPKPKPSLLAVFATSWSLLNM